MTKIAIVVSDRMGEPGSPLIRTGWYEKNGRSVLVVQGLLWFMGTEAIFSERFRPWLAELEKRLDEFDVVVFNKQILAYSANAYVLAERLGKRAVVMADTITNPAGGTEYTFREARILIDDGTGHRSIEIFKNFLETGGVSL